MKITKMLVFILIYDIFCIKTGGYIFQNRSLILFFMCYFFILLVLSLQNVINEAWELLKSGVKCVAENTKPKKDDVQFLMYTP